MFALPIMMITGIIYIVITLWMVSRHMQGKDQLSLRYPGFLFICGLSAFAAMMCFIMVWWTITSYNSDPVEPIKYVPPETELKTFIS